MKNKYYVQTVLYELVHGYYFEVSGQQVIKKETRKTAGENIPGN